MLAKARETFCKISFKTLRLQIWRQSYIPAVEKIFLTTFTYGIIRDNNEHLYSTF